MTRSEKTWCFRWITLRIIPKIMGFEKQSQRKETLNERFRKYGIDLSEDGLILGREKPEQFGKTPEFMFRDSGQNILEAEKPFLTERFGKAFSVYEHQESVMRIVDSVVQDITGSPFKNFTDIVIVSQNDFKEYARAAAPRLKTSRGILGDFHGINLGGLVIVQDVGGDNCFPLLFHEIGHNMYPNEGLNYLDELRAMYFQILCTKKLEAELVKIGLNFSYPDDYYKEYPLPTKEHEKAFEDARVLFIYQSQYEAVVKGSERAEKREQELLKKVNQTKKSFG